MKSKDKKNCPYPEQCPIEYSYNCKKLLECPRCGLTMELVNCYIPKEEMHFNHHTESCSDWVCRCGFSTYVGAITGELYPYKKIIIKKEAK